MIAMKNLLVALGFLVEAYGLTLTAVGLWRTWKANTDGREPLWPWLRQCADYLLYKVLRRKRAAVVLAPAASAHAHASLSASGYSHTPLNDEMTVEQKIETVQANALTALQLAAGAHGAVTEEQGKRERAFKGLEDRITGTETELRTYATRLVVDGIPMAIGGLVLIGLGLLVQTVGNLI